MNSRFDHKNYKRRKWKRRITFIISITFLFLILVIAYGKIGYESARKNSLEAMEEQSFFIANQSEEVIPFHAEVVEKNGPVHILLIGVDRAQDNRSRTDTIMIAQYHPTRETAKLASIMRDTYVNIPEHQPNKINASFFLGGPELLRQTIKENFDIDLHYYAMVNFDGFERIVDTIAPNGIEINVEHRMYKPSIQLHFEPGKQTVDGKDALKYVRFRDDHENDFGRVRRQQEVLSILKEEMISFRGVTKVPQLIGSIEPYLDTNMTTSKILSLGKDFFLNPVDELEMMTIPIENSFTDKRYRHAGLVLDIDIEKNKNALHEFFRFE